MESCVCAKFTEVIFSFVSSFAARFVFVVLVHYIGMEVSQGQFFSGSRFIYHADTQYFIGLVHSWA